MRARRGCGSVCPDGSALGLTRRPAGRRGPTLRRPCSRSRVRAGSASESGTPPRGDAGGAGGTGGNPGPGPLPPRRRGVRGRAWLAIEQRRDDVQTRDGEEEHHQQQAHGHGVGQHAQLAGRDQDRRDQRRDEWDHPDAKPEVRLALTASPGEDDEGSEQEGEGGEPHDERRGPPTVRGRMWAGSTAHIRVPPLVPLSRSNRPRRQTRRSSGPDAGWADGSGGRRGEPGR